ncbi:MAG: antitoxin [Acetobacteraceae bacterium]|nr:antitoxin [Acetobacteraceae bacterium]
MANSKVQSLFHVPPDEAEEAHLDALADADFDAGQFVSHDDVVKWLKSWGQADELPCPTPKLR